METKIREREITIENVCLDTLSSVDREKFSYLFIFKIILIGDANIGKTSLINRYVTNIFNEKYLCTIGVDFMMKSINYDNQLIKLQIWDTAGMEKYKQITTSYYRGAQAAIVCFDLTSKSSFESVRRWIDDFSQFYNPIFQKTIILVGNKADLIEQREVTELDIENFRKINNYVYFEASAKTGDNVETIFLELAKKLYSAYKSNVDTQIKNAVQIRKSVLNGVDKFQNLIDKKESNKNKKNCC